MGTMKRRVFLKTAAFACPVLAAGVGPFLEGGQKKEDQGLTVLKDKCTGCGDCVKVCPVEAIKLKDGKAVIDDGECIECDACIDECPSEAILYKEALAQNHAENADRTEPAKKTEERPGPLGGLDLGGVWIMTGTFADGSTSSEPITFAGTASAGILKSAAGGEPQGSYKIAAGQVEIRLPDGSLAKGRVVSSNRLEGSLPAGAGTWRAEKKK